MEIWTIVLSIITGVFMPWAIQYVARSTKSWLNMLISYGSSALIGAFSAWFAGSFSNDVYASILAAITAAQLAYTAYWKEAIRSKITVTPVGDNIEQ